MVMSLGVESCDWFALSLLCHHLMSSLHSNTPRSLITTYLLFILFINVNLFHLQSVYFLFLSSYFSLILSWPPALVPSGEGLSASRLSLLRRTSSTSSPPRSPSHSRGSRGSCSSIIHNQLLPSANSSPSASPFATPQNTPPTAHRASSSLRSPGPSQQGPELLVAWGLREDIPEVVVFPPEEEEEEPHLLFSATQEEQVAHDPGRLAQLLLPPQSGKYPAHQHDVSPAWKICSASHYVCHEWLSLEKSHQLHRLKKIQIKTEIMLYTMS